MVGVPQAKQSIWLIRRLDPTVKMPSRDRGVTATNCVLMGLMRVYQKAVIARRVLEESFEASRFILIKRFRESVSRHVLSFLQRSVIKYVTRRRVHSCGLYFSTAHL